PKSRLYASQLSTATGTERSGAPGAAGPLGGSAQGAAYAGSRDGPRGATPRKAATSIRTPVSARRGSSNFGYTPGAPSSSRSRVAIDSGRVSTSLSPASRGERETH